MTGNEYQKAALRTANMDYSSHGMIINGALGLCGEAGEVADIIKKSTFQGHKLDTEHIAEELGDVAWYLAITAAAIGVNLDLEQCWYILRYWFKNIVTRKDKHHENH